MCGHECGCLTFCCHKQGGVLVLESTTVCLQGCCCGVVRNLSQGSNAVLGRQRDCNAIMDDGLLVAGRLTESSVCVAPASRASQVGRMRPSAAVLSSECRVKTAPASTHFSFSSTPIKTTSVHDSFSVTCQVQLFVTRALSYPKSPLDKTSVAPNSSTSLSHTFSPLLRNLTTQPPSENVCC